MQVDRERSRRRSPLRRVGAALMSAVVGAMALPAAAVLALPAGCVQNVLTVTCTYLEGTTSTFTVPRGVSTISVVAIGGRGGTAASTHDGFYPGAPGGFGARVTGDLAVTAGQPLHVVVGGNGGLGLGGFNGGGFGAPAIEWDAAASGGGGGATDIRTSLGDLGSRLIVAGGGGGGGGNGAFYGVGGPGGDAAEAGDRGTDYGGLCGDDPCFARGGGGGQPGTGTAGGAGGAGGHFANVGLIGWSGSAGTLGNGGDAGACECSSQGGGGAGLYGGGSGGSGGAFDDRPLSSGGSGGGGGGSSLVPAGGTLAVDATGTPKLVITYTAPVAINPSALGFGTQAVGSTSAAKAVTLSATGSAAVAVASASLIGSHAGDFSVTSDGCSGTTVAAGASCTVQVAFAPTTTGARFASLRIVDDGPDGPRDVLLSGTGTMLADVRVAITGPATAPTGSQNTYAITVSNAGPSGATSVVLTTQVPSGTKFVALSSTKGTCSRPAAGATSGTISCSLGDLASGSSAVGSVTLKITLTGKGGSIAIVAQAASSGTGATPDPSLGNNVTTFVTTVTRK